MFNRPNDLKNSAFSADDNVPRNHNTLNSPNNSCLIIGQKVGNRV